MCHGVSACVTVFNISFNLSIHCDANFKIPTNSVKTSNRYRIISHYKTGMTKKKGATHVAPNLLDIILITIDICMDLLADAEISKNIPENLIGRNLSHNAAEVVDGFADILGSEVCWEA